jgi:hypothetical protein
MFDAESIASTVGILPADACRWHEEDVPLERRGVSLSWLGDLAMEFVKTKLGIADRLRYQNEASRRYDNVPPAEYPPFELEGGTSTALFAEHIVRPLTKALRCPLYARVPERYRGTPTTFVSHTWSSELAGYAYSIVRSGVGRNEFVWIDIGCYNQHAVDEPARHMKQVIASIGHLTMPIVWPGPFNRTWCLWEIVCAHIAGAPIEFTEPTAQARDVGGSREAFRDTFKSTADSVATYDVDKKSILAEMVTAFGSLSRADSYIVDLFDSKLPRALGGRSS